ncbi:hypothetical protein BRD00_06765 [Halobacteriales archaeon QS_8_69_26]|nr:MAG: hypothetical protein BRD00_06765 [Halobacteriales archaeon QS_8_69_26]
MDDGPVQLHLAGLEEPPGPPLETLSRRVGHTGRNEGLPALTRHGLVTIGSRPPTDTPENYFPWGPGPRGQHLAVETADAPVLRLDVRRELVVAPRSDLVGESLVSANFRQRYDATVLALRRGPELVRHRMDRVNLRVGDTLLVQATPESIERLGANRDFIVAGVVERPDYRREGVPVAVGIVAAVVVLAAPDVLPIVVAALAGALAMVLTGCLRPTGIYDAVQWDVVFLLGGIIPLGIAMQSSGAAALVADALVATAAVVPPIVVLGLFYVVTALLTDVISNDAAVVLMIPVAFRAAADMGAPPISFLFAVTFAASTAFMIPVGYQTDLFVYGPGGYRFLDYVRVGAPLRALFAVVTTVGIAVIWGI